MTSLITDDGRRLGYRRFGSGPMVVGHPGGPGFASGSLRDLGGMDRSHELVLLDPRGSGGSDGPPDDDYGLAAYASDLDQLLVHVGGTARALVGHSHGGMVALLHAATLPNRYDRLVLADTPAHLDRRVLVSLGDAGRGGDAADGPRGVVDEDEPPAPAAAAAWLRLIGEDDALDAGHLGGDLGLAALRHFAGHQLGSFDLRPLCAGISVPVLVVCGRDDEVAGPTAGAELVELLEDARLEVVEDSGHVPYRENPTGFRAAVEPFLAGG